MPEKKKRNRTPTPDFVLVRKKTRERTGDFSKKLHTPEQIRENYKRYIREWRKARPGWNKAACRKYNAKVRARKLQAKLEAANVELKSDQKNP